MTKKAILHTALHQFSQKGYTATSIREIASAVGIKESSVYAHFASKEEIFRSVIEHYDFLQSALVDMEEILDNPFTVLSARAESIIASYDNLDYIAYSKLTQMEMLKDGPARELVRSESFDKVEIFFENMLVALMDNKTLKETDKSLILAEFIGPFHYLHMKIISGWLADGEKEIVITTMRKHLKYFLESFRRIER